LFAVAVLVARLAMVLLSVRVQAGVTYRVTTALRTRLAHAYLHSSWATQQQQPAGSLQQLVVTFPNQAGNLVGNLAGAGGAGLTLAAMLLVAVVIDATTTGVVIIVLALLALILRPIRKGIERRSQGAVDTQVRFANNVAETGMLALEIQTFGVRDHVEAELDQMIHDYAAAERRVNLLAQAVSPVYVSLAYGAVLLAIAVIAGLSAGTLASVGAVMLIMLRSLGYGQQMQNGSAILHQVLPFLDRLEASTQAFTSSATRHGNRQIESIGQIEFHNVCFAYLDGPPVLQDMSFTIDPGEAIGIVGASGSGKTTLVQLLLGLRTPDAGIITFAGVPLDDIAESSLRSRLSFVPQHPSLINGSLRDNIVFFRDGITENQIINALEAAHLESFVRSLPAGLESNIGSAGHMLSGGQQQRLTIARALVTQPEVIVMDEPTSALDDTAEAVIRDTIADLSGNHTVVVIAHRPSTIKACTRLIQLD
jgi:ABC-type multidrug transport system fused ATPase/permease subunit